MLLWINAFTNNKSIFISNVIAPENINKGIAKLINFLEEKLFDSLTPSIEK